MSYKEISFSWIELLESESNLTQKIHMENSSVLVRCFFGLNLHEILKKKRQKKLTTFFGEGKGEGVSGGSIHPL